jgi:outer membrane protein
MVCKVYLMKGIVFFLASYFFSTFSFCQNEVWTLDKCLDHLLQNNLDLKITTFSIDKAETNKSFSNSIYLPSINGNANHGYNWGQSIDPFTNKFATNQVRTNSFYLSSSVVLFSGLQRYNLQKISQSEYLNEYFNLEVQKRNLKINFTALYLQTLLNQKSLELAKKQVLLLEKQRERIQEFVEFKKMTQYDLLEIEAQLSVEQSSLFKKECDYKISLLDVYQTLHLAPEIELKIDTSLVSSIEFTNIQINDLAEIKAKEEEYKSAMLFMYQLRGKLFPSISLFSSVGTGYSGNNKELINGQMVSKQFSQQLNDNFYQSLGVNLSIPLFNKLNTRKDLQLAKIEIEKSKLIIENTKLQLTLMIEKLKNEITMSEMNQIQLEKSLQVLKKSFEVATTKFELGVINIYNYLDAKTKLVQVENELIQSKYEVVFKKKILSLYID